MMSWIPTKIFAGVRAVLDGTEQTSVWAEIWEYLVNKYFSVSLENYNYSHIRVNGGSIFSLRAIIVGISIGLIIAAAASMFQKRTLGDLVRAIGREMATTPEKAMTLTELGVERNAAIKQDLRHGTSLRRVVRCVEEEAFVQGLNEKREAFEAAVKEGKEKGKWREIAYRHDFENEHFYIPEDKIIGADIQFDKKGSNWLTFGFTVAVCIFLMSLCCFLLPEMLQLADNFVGVFSAS